MYNVHIYNIYYLETFYGKSKLNVLVLFLLITYTVLLNKPKKTTFLENIT